MTSGVGLGAATRSHVHYIYIIAEHMSGHPRGDCRQLGVPERAWGGLSRIEQPHDGGPLQILDGLLKHGPTTSMRGSLGCPRWWAGPLGYGHISKVQKSMDLTYKRKSRKMDVCICIWKQSRIHRRKPCPCMDPWRVMAAAAHSSMGCRGRQPILLHITAVETTAT